MGGLDTWRKARSGTGFGRTRTRAGPPRRDRRRMPRSKAGIAAPMASRWYGPQTCPRRGRRSRAPDSPAPAREPRSCAFPNHGARLGAIALSPRMGRMRRDGCHECKPSSARVEPQRVPRDKHRPSEPPCQHAATSGRSRPLRRRSALNVEIVPRMFRRTPTILPYGRPKIRAHHGSDSGKARTRSTGLGHGLPAINRPTR